MAGYDALPPAPSSLRQAGSAAPRTLRHWPVLVLLIGCAEANHSGAKDAAADVLESGDGPVLGPSAGEDAQGPEARTPEDGGSEVAPGSGVAPMWRTTSIFGDPTLDDPDGGAGDAAPDAGGPTSSRVSREGEAFVLEHQGHGARLGGSLDSLVFLHQTVREDATLTVRLRELRGCPAGASGSFGVMLRQSTSEDAAYLLGAFTAPGGATVQMRHFGGGFASPLRIDSQAELPLWLRIERRGPAVRAGTSQDGQSFRMGQEDAAWFGTTVEMGLAASATAAGCAAVFDAIWLER